MEQLETLGARDHLKPIESKSEICQVLGVVHGGWTMEVSVTPPPLHGPTAKEKKYDRQLRLWAASGQQALEDAHILLLNNGSGVVGIETLKNLVLPGVGTFTIVDEHTVEEEDLGVNFFLSEDSLGKPRGEQCRNYLQELNPEVKLFSVQQVCYYGSYFDIRLTIAVHRGLHCSGRSLQVHFNSPREPCEALYSCENNIRVGMETFNTTLLCSLCWLLLPFLSPASPNIPNRRYTP